MKVGFRTTSRTAVEFIPIRMGGERIVAIAMVAKLDNIFEVCM